ncbi:uncharacterized protein LOC141695659 [Apium graveolens]|uniref:uncharacterized protein LOC141695659 n=1 Tax=Apium graveolens TaxID=4045 RepID=UPI003D78BCD7
MKNHESRPTGSSPFPETNVVTYNYGRGRGGGRDGNCGCGRGYGHGNGAYGRGSQVQKHPSFKFNKSNSNQKLVKNMNKEKKKKNIENECYRCGMKCHWSRTCRMPKYFVDFYQASLKDKGKNIETNLVFEEKEHAENLLKMTYLDTANFYKTPDDTTAPDNK